MISITRSLARQVRAVLRRLLRGGHHADHPLVIEAGPSGLSISAAAADAVVEHRAGGERPAERLVVPFQLLADCEGRKDDPVEIEAQGDKGVIVRWQDGNVPQVVTRKSAPERPVSDKPTLPATLIENPASLLGSLSEAGRVTDSGAVRYATCYVQLAGADGSLRATDGRQCLVQGGFAFPWKDELLIPKLDLFGVRELQGQPVRIGRTEKWVTLLAGPWTIHLRMQEGRFPKIAAIIPKAETLAARLRISEADARFLADALPRLPRDDTDNCAVTVDLNGSIAVRAKAADQGQPTELLLSGSSYTGSPVRLAMNREYLARALRLGFREVQCGAPESPVLCHDDCRSYLWAMLSPESALPPSENAVRLISPAESPSPPPVNRIKRTLPMHQPRSRPQATEANVAATSANGQATSRPQIRRRKADARETTQLIDQADKLRTALRALLVQANDLVKGLKQHRRQSRIVANTLRQLKTIGVG